MNFLTNLRINSQLNNTAIEFSNLSTLMKAYSVLMAAHFLLDMQVFDRLLYPKKFPIQECYDLYRETEDLKNLQEERYAQQQNYLHSTLFLWITIRAMLWISKFQSVIPCLIKFVFTFQTI